MATRPITHSLVDLDSIPRFRSMPIRKVPKYLFENCNQRTLNNYDTRNLIGWRAVTQEIRPSNIKRIDASKDKKIKKAEEIDWIFALDRLEKEYLAKDGFMLDTALRVQDILQMNGYLSRLAEDDELREEDSRPHTPGSCRKDGNHFWRKHNFDANEKIVFQMIMNELYSDISELSANEQDQLFSSLSSFHPRFKIKIDINSIELKKLLEKEKTECKCLINLEALDPKAFEQEFDKKLDQIIEFYDQINPDIVYEWQDEDGNIDLIKWIRDRIYFFPAASDIKQELEKSIDSIKKPKMHPIEKAAKIWFDIVKIHMSLEANKRTGRAIGSAILLSHGYLPPKINTKEEADEYIDCFIHGFEEKDGLIRFTNFIANQILKIQEKFESDLRDISELS